MTSSASNTIVQDNRIHHAILISYLMNTPLYISSFNIQFLWHSFQKCIHNRKHCSLILGPRCTKHNLNNICLECMTNLAFPKFSTTFFSPRAYMLFLKTLCIRIKILFVLTSNWTYRITTFFTHKEIIFAHYHQRIIRGRFHLQFLPSINKKSFLCHDLALRITNIVVLTLKRPIWLSQWNFCSLGFGNKSFSWLNSFLPMRLINNRLAGNTLFTISWWLCSSVVPCHTRFVLAFRNIYLFPVLPRSLRQFSNISAGIQFTICNNLCIRSILRNCKL